MSPKEARDGSKETQYGPEMSPVGLKIGQDGSKRLQEEHKLAQNGARRDQNGGRMATQMENMVLTKVLKSFEFLPKT